MTRRRFEFTGRPFSAAIQVPGDKSLSHRALLLAGFASGVSRLAGLAPGADLRATIGCLVAVGVEVAGEEVTSPGIDGWSAPEADLDAQNSGSTLRMLAGALAGRSMRVRIAGDSSLMRRPMARLVAPLEALGARVSVSSDGTPPVIVEGGQLRGTDIDIPIPSAQVRTAASLAGLQAEGTTTITSPPGFRDHTERWFSNLGLGRALTENSFEIQPAPVPCLDIRLPGDTSSAANLWVAAALSGSYVSTPGVSLNPGRTGILDVLEAMGARVKVTVTGEVMGDPFGEVIVEGPVRIATAVSGELAVRTLDELPLVGILATAGDGTTVVAGAGELRGKESDRIAATVNLVKALGGTATATADGFKVEAGNLRPGVVDASGDHRVALAAAVAAVRAGSVDIEGYEAVEASWPGFESTLESMWS